MNVFKLETRNAFKSTLIWTISLCAVIFFMLAFFPSMQTEAMKTLAATKMEGMSSALLAAMGLSVMIDFSVVTNYFGYVLQYLALAIMVYAAQQAATLLVKEETEGTISFLFAKPLNRETIFLQKAAANVCLLFFMLLLCFFATVIGYVLYSSSTFGTAVKECGIMFLGVFFVALVYTAIGWPVSAIVRSSKSATGAAMAIVFGSFVLGVASVLIKGLPFFKYLSPMDWIKTDKLLTIGLTPEEWFVGLSVLIVCPSLALLIYRRRDYL